MKMDKKRKLEELFLKPFAVNVNPNLITLVSILAMLFAGYFVLNKELFLAAFFVVLSGVLDALDGVIARVHHRITRFGSFFDKTADRVNDSVIIISIILAGYVCLNLGLAVLVVVLISSYMSAVIDAISRKPIGEKISLRPLRILLIFFGCLLSQLELAMILVFIVGLYGFMERFLVAFSLKS